MSHRPALALIATLLSLLVVSVAAGGGADKVARMVSEKMGQVTIASRDGLL